MRPGAFRPPSPAVGPPSLRAAPNRDNLAPSFLSKICVQVRGQLVPQTLLLLRAGVCIGCLHNLPFPPQPLDLIPLIWAHEQERNARSGDQLKLWG
jgi:hypothetical protein